MAKKIVQKDRQPRKLDLPTFDGTDPDAWIFRAERYFAVNGLTEKEQLEAVGVCFEGEAQSWLRFEERDTPFSFWEELKTQLLQRFLGPDEGTLIRRFFAVKQSGTVLEYRSQFEMIAAAVGKMEESYMIAVFVNGLEEKIRAELAVLNPVGLKETMLAAARIEKKNELLQPKTYSKTHKELPYSLKTDMKTIPWTPSKLTSTPTVQPTSITYAHQDQRPTPSTHTYHS